MGEVVVEGSWRMERKRRMNTEEEKEKKNFRRLEREKNNIERKPTYRFYLIATYHFQKRRKEIVKSGKYTKSVIKI